MSTVAALVRAHTALPPAAAEHLHRLVARWQLLADLSFADLLLWVDVRPGLREEVAGHLAGGREGALLSVAQVRPVTGPTSYPEDRVGAVVTHRAEPALAAALRDTAPDAARDLEAPLPVRHGGRVVAVLGRRSGGRGAGAGSGATGLEEAYRQAARALAAQVARGGFPPPGEGEPGPSVGDGTVLLDRAGAVAYASPNARSALRRLGVPDPEAAPLLPALALLGPVALAADAPGGAELDTGGAVVQLSVVPLAPPGPGERGAPGPAALVLLRDVTELRRRDRALLTLDATLREVHHRVSNDLQTVAALLRLQARRSGDTRVRTALGESERRVSAIALVHQLLSRAMDDSVVLDPVVDRLLALACEVGPLRPGVVLRRTGTGGVLRGDVATPLVLAVSELVHNALEHGLARGGTTVEVHLERTPTGLVVEVRDDGAGLSAHQVAGHEVAGQEEPGQEEPGQEVTRPEEAGRGATEGLGLQVVRTLVEGQLSGTLALRPGPGGGVVAALDLPLPAGPPDDEPPS